MTSVFEDARQGILVDARLDAWLKDDQTYLEQEEPSTGWTLLAIAAAYGFPQEVDQLLRRGAKPYLRCRDGETPLLLAAWKATKERPLLVQTILRRTSPESTEATTDDTIDATCDAAENKTPLMYAIDNSDIETVAENTKNKSILRALNPGKEQSDLARLSSIVITVILNVVAWVNTALDNVVKRIFGISGERNQSTNERINPGPEEPTPEQFVKNVDVFVKDNPVLNAFFKGKKDFIQDLAQKSVNLSEDPTTDLGCPELLPKTTLVTMHQQVIYCDDSSSMNNTRGKIEGRWENQKNLALRISRITTRILPDGEGVALRFINKDSDGLQTLDFAGIEKGIDEAAPNGDTPIGTNLRKKILDPMIYSKIKSQTIERPLLISIITDGSPSRENREMLADTIVECGDKLVEAGLPRDSVKFLIGQVGSAESAARFLDSLRNNENVIKVAHIFAGMQTR
ncbi:hypothetical protein ONZ43_g7294 [Nemania bipapillata]|uniref:Uncharacterized protein n=1 Tax=Nemania bipapillata TaxID=110536 RepID=A0ACC2HSL2_9PEZI|nr:hypothetical protein ONZ43_g7294 [Nemania bipapillata]